jgi:hypothetical protein
MSIIIRLFLIFLCAIVLANKGVASNNEGVYIVEAESVVFFSDAYQIINLKNEEKLVLYSCPTATIIKKEFKVPQKVKIVQASNNSKNILKNEEIKIPLKHIVFNVKNTKNLNFSILKPRDTNIIFYISSLSKAFQRTDETIPLGINNNYFVQKQVVRDLFYSVLSTISLAGHYSFVLFLVLSLFFCKYVRELSKNSVYILKRGPPISSKI